MCYIGLARESCAPPSNPLLPLSLLGQGTAHLAPFGVPAQRG